MKQFKDFSSFFFPSKGTFGGVQRRSANGYDNVRKQDRRRVVYSGKELQAALSQQKAGDTIILGSDVEISEPITLTENDVTIDLNGRLVRPRGIVESAIRLKGQDGEDGKIIRRPIVMNGEFYGVNALTDYFKMVVDASSVYVNAAQFLNIRYRMTAQLCGYVTSDANTKMVNVMFSNCQIHIEDFAADILAYNPSDPAVNIVRGEKVYLKDCFLVNDITFVTDADNCHIGYCYFDTLNAPSNTPQNNIITNNRNTVAVSGFGTGSPNFNVVANNRV